MNPPILTPNAITYAWARLWAIAGANGLDLPHEYGPATTPLAQPGIIITPSPPDAWTRLLNLPPHSLNRLPAATLFPPGYPLPFDDELPILFWDQADQTKPPIVVRDDGSIVFRFDLLAATLFMLSRWEETVLPRRDEHDRFPATASLAYRQGFLDQPIIDRYALILRAWLQKLRPAWRPQPRTFQLRLSHDIDHLRRFRTVGEGLRLIAGDVRRGRPEWIIESISHLLSGRLALPHNPFFTALDTFAAQAETLGTHATFYISTATASPYEVGYNVQHPALVGLLRNLDERGHIIALHPSYHTYLDAERYLQEKMRLEKILGHAVCSARQHFLRFCVPDTWRVAEAVGMSDEASLGYADHEGFRAGTAHPFPPFDWQQDRVIKLVEHPLHVMENTLAQYRGLSPAQGVERLYLLACRAAEVGGELHLLWHNSSIVREWRPWYARYRRFLQDMQQKMVSPT